MSKAAAARIEAALAAPLAEAGFDVEDVVVRAVGSRSLVQVVVDRDGGITLDDVADASRVVSDVLDGTDVVAGSYVLEVTSRGVDRPLTLPRHWRRNVGRLVDVRRHDGAPVRGRIAEAGETAATITTDAGDAVVDFADVVRATVQVEFTRASDTVAEEAAR